MEWKGLTMLEEDKELTRHDTLKNVYKLFLFSFVVMGHKLIITFRYLSLYTVIDDDISLYN